MIPLPSMRSLCDTDTWKRARIGTFTQFKGNLSIKGEGRRDTVMQSTRIKRQLSIKRLGQERHCYAVCTYPKGMYQLMVRAGGTLLCYPKGMYQLKARAGRVLCSLRREEATLLCSLHDSKGNVSMEGEEDAAGTTLLCYLLSC